MQQHPERCRRVRLSSAGEQMADYAARIPDLWCEAGDEMAAQRGVFSGRLRVGAVTKAEYLPPPLLLVEFTGRQPKIKVKLCCGNRAEIVQMLARRDIDLAIMGRPPTERQARSTGIACAGMTRGSSAGGVSGECGHLQQQLLHGSVGSQHAAVSV